MSTYLALIVMAYATNRFGKTYGIDSSFPGPGGGAMPLVFWPGPFGSTMSLFYLLRPHLIFPVALPVCSLELDGGRP
jgi:hypothetical protein